MPEIDNETAGYCDQIIGRYTGDASAESILEFKLEGTNQTHYRPEAKAESQDDVDEEDVEEEEEKDHANVDVRRITITEEKRLARLIQLVDRNASVVPKGYFYGNCST